MKESVFLRQSKNIRIIISIFVIIYLIPYFYNDTFSFLSLLSPIGLTYLLYPIKTERETGNIPKKKLYIIIACLSVFLSFALMYLYIFGSLDNGVIVNGFRILPSVTYIVYIIVPIVWFVKEYRGNPFRIFKLDRKKLLFMVLICLPIILNDFINVFNYNLLNYAVININEYWYNLYQVFIIAAFIEELFFRGFMYSLLKKIFSVNVSMILSSLVFTLWHLNLLKKLYYAPSLFIVINMLAIFLLGIANSFIFERCKSLWPSVIFHAVIDGGLKFGLILVLTVFH